jgi:flagellar protein FlaG
VIQVLLESVSSVMKSSNPTLAPSMAANTAVQGRIPREGKRVADEEKKAADLSQLAKMAMGREIDVEGLRNVDLNFSVHEASGQIMVSVVDKETGDVIREIPSEALLDLAAKLQEVAGLIFDKKA